MHTTNVYALYIVIYIYLITVVFAFGDVTSTTCEFWLPSTLNVTVVVTVKLFVNGFSFGVVGLLGVVGLDHRGGGAGGVLL